MLINRSASISESIRYNRLIQFNYFINYFSPNVRLMSKSKLVAPTMEFSVTYFLTPIPNQNATCLPMLHNDHLMTKSTTKNSSATRVPIPPACASESVSGDPKKHTQLHQPSSTTTNQSNPGAPSPYRDRTRGHSHTNIYRLPSTACTLIIGDRWE